jgi:hypothetical protein
LKLALGELGGNENRCADRNEIVRVLAINKRGVEATLHHKPSPRIQSAIRPDQLLADIGRGKPQELFQVSGTIAAPIHLFILTQESIH